MALTLLKVIQQQIGKKSKLTDDYGKAIESSEQSIDSVLSAINTSRIIHITSATDAPTFKDIGTLETPKEDGVDDGSEVSATTNTLGKSGLLVVMLLMIVQLQHGIQTIQMMSTQI